MHECPAASPLPYHGQQTPPGSLNYSANGMARVHVCSYDFLILSYVFHMCFCFLCVRMVFQWFSYVIVCILIFPIAALLFSYDFPNGVYIFSYYGFQILAYKHVQWF